MPPVSTIAASPLKRVSVIMPVLNEAETIQECLNSLFNDDYPLELIELVVADGGSHDATLEKIRAFCELRSGLKVTIIHNSQRTQGYGLNRALEKVNPQTEIVLRVDAHAVYPRRYITDCIQTLLDVKADNVGGVMTAIGRGPWQKAIAFCMSHWLGVGNAQFHLGGQSGYVDTVYLGCFDRNIFLKLGFFDPLMTPNEDAEFNLRILRNQGRVFLNHNIRVSYYPRKSLFKLWKQYYHYGRGRCRTVLKHGRMTSLRQAMPPLWVSTTILCVGLSFLSYLGLAPLFVYFGVLLSVAFYYAVKMIDINLVLTPLCFATMHYAYGVGFLTQLFKRGKRSNYLATGEDGVC